jgi:5-oxoprolinase (ATP-hydrolysing) subunit A
MQQIDLNADMGESYGDWSMGDDAAMLDVVTSANIACGFHAGDADVMAATMRMAVARGIGLGAHPGLPDLQGFGRRTMAIPAATLANMVRYQLGAAIAMAQSVGGTIRHVKLHGALAHMAAADPDIAERCFAAVLDLDPTLVLLVMAATPMQAAAERLGGNWVGEVFADRAYNDDGTLVNRAHPHAMIHDPALAAKRMRDMVRDGDILTTSGRHIPAKFGSICVHGDTPQALSIARSVRAALQADGVHLAPFGTHPA